MSVRVKICGLRSREAVEAAIDAGADEIGFVFFPASPRDISLSDAQRLAGLASGRVDIVALTVDAEDALLDAIVERIRPQVLQLHGHESIARTRFLAEHHGTKIWKAMPVASRADVDAARDYIGAADKLLFDAKPPAGARHPGGNGVSFDWSLLEDARGLPYVLSGGLEPRTVAAAIAATGATAVDVSSGVEREPGVKDAGLIRAFVRAAKAAR